MLSRKQETYGPMYHIYSIDLCVEQKVKVCVCMLSRKQGLCLCVEQKARFVSMLSRKQEICVLSRKQ